MLNSLSKSIAFLINAAPGSAKTAFMLKRILRRIKQGLVQPSDVIILAFSRKKAAELRQKLRSLNEDTGRTYGLNKIKVKTFHAYALWLLKSQGGYFGMTNSQDKQLRILQEPENEKEILAEAMDLPREFSQLVKLLAQRFAENRIKIDSNYKLIAVDEFQVLYRTLVECLIGILVQSDYPELLLVGDSGQDVYSWTKVGDEEINPFSDLIEPLKNRYVLKFPELHYRRGTPGIKELHNGFERLLGEQIQRIHKSLIRKAEECPVLYYAKPKLILEQNKKSQRNRLEAEMGRIKATYPNDSIMSIGRNKWIAIDRSKDVEESFQTVHSALGSEADHIIWSDYSNGECSDVLKGIIRVAISRAKKTLTIISTDPESLAIKWFDPGTFELINNQRITPVYRRRKNLKLVHKDRNKSLKKQTVIDSIDCRVSHESAPFNPWLSRTQGSSNKWLIPHETTYKTLKLGSGTVLEDLPTYCIQAKIGKNGNRSHIFQFRSLDFLRRNGYSDRDILDALKNEISYWFDDRIDMREVEISRIDLAGLFICDAEQKAELVQQLAYSKATKGRFKTRTMWAYNAQRDKFSEVQPDSHSAYVNYGQTKAGITVLGYDPSKKPPSKETRQMNLDNNRLADRAYHNDDLFKIEIKLHGKTIESRLGTKFLTELCESTDGLVDQYIQLSHELGIVDGNKVLGLEFSKKSWGVFEVKKSGNIDRSLAELALTPISKSAISANNSNAKHALSSGWGGRATISATEFLRRYL